MRLGGTDIGRRVRALRATALAALALLGGCSVMERREVEPPAAPVPPAPRDIASIPDAVPRPEPRSRRGNPPFYEVRGKRYYVLSTAEGYVERGVASWYGPGFHNSLTSMGEPYDMYAMTAAHKTLPLPSYVRVTNLRNGRSVVVRVNDRGPFVDNRIIDLSYTAAVKLDMIRDGTTLVEVRAITPGQPDLLTRAAQSPPPALYVQAGAFADERNAARLAERARAAGLASVFVQPPSGDGPRLHRVRVGPVGSVEEFDRIVAQLERLGIRDAHLAVD